MRSLVSRTEYIPSHTTMSSTLLLYLVYTVNVQLMSEPKAFKSQIISISYSGPQKYLGTFLRHSSFFFFFFFISWMYKVSCSPSH